MSGSATGKYIRWGGVYNSTGLSRHSSFLIFIHRFARQDLVSLYGVLGVQSVHGVQDLESTGKEMKEWQERRPWDERIKEVQRWLGARGRLHRGVEEPIDALFWEILVLC